MPKQAFNVDLIFGDRYSDLVLGYVEATGDIGYAFKEVLLTKTDTLTAGSVLKADLTEVADDSEADDSIYVLAWSDTFPLISQLATGTVFKAVVVARGATLNGYKVKFADGTQINEAGVDQLDSLGVKVTFNVLQPTT